MIDFHSHILPGVDDGARNLEESLVMLREAFLQGVTAVVSTSHFYAADEFPGEFLERRNSAVQQLQEAMLFSEEVYPVVIAGAEILYFPGISEAEGIDRLRIENSRCILIEPPMSPWSEDMLDDIQQLGRNYDLIPVIAHLDRYISILKDSSLIDRVCRRNMVVQVNGSYFLNPKTKKAAIEKLKAGKIGVIGSDCHNMDSRPPNLGLVRRQIQASGVQTAFRQVHRNAADLLTNRRR